MGCGFLDSGDSIQVFSKITIVVGFRGGGWWAGVPWEQYQYQWWLEFGGEGREVIYSG